MTFKARPARKVISKHRISGVIHSLFSMRNVTGRYYLRSLLWRRLVNRLLPLITTVYRGYGRQGRGNGGKRFDLGIDGTDLACLSTLLLIMNDEQPADPRFHDDLRSPESKLARGKERGFPYRKTMKTALKQVPSLNLYEIYQTKRLERLAGVQPMMESKLRRFPDLICPKTLVRDWVGVESLCYSLTHYVRQRLGLEEPYLTKGRIKKKKDFQETRSNRVSGPRKRPRRSKAKTVGKGLPGLE